MSSINIEKVSQDGLLMKFKITVPSSIYKELYNKKLSSLQQKVVIDGFRKGKAPISIIEKKYQGDVMIESFEDTISKGLKALYDSDQSINPINRPDINQEDLSKSLAAIATEDISFEISFENAPNFGLEDFSDIAINEYDVIISDDELESALDKIIESNKPLEVVPDELYEAQDGDVVVINYSGHIDGKKFEGGTAEHQELVLGSKSFIDGFEEQLIGKKAGEELEVKVKFPDNYHSEDLKGQDAIFDVKIIEIKKYGECYSKDDELAGKLGFTKGMPLEEFKDGLRKHKMDELKQSKYNARKLDLFDILDEKISIVELPKTILEMEIKSMTEQLKNSDKSEDDIIKLARRRVALGLFIIQIAEKNNITVSDQEVRNAVFDKARSFPGYEMYFVNMISENKKMLENLKNEVLEDKVTNFILNKAQSNSVEMGYSDFLKKVEGL